MEHFEDINSRDEANEAVLENGMALRIQPPAPNATVYYFTESGDWKRQKCGHSIETTVDAGAVRSAVDRAIPKNDDAGGGGVKAVEMEQVERYA